LQEYTEELYREGLNDQDNKDGMVKNLPAMKETQVQLRVRKIPWRRNWQPTPVILTGESHGQRSLMGYRPQVRKSWTQWSD